MQEQEFENFTQFYNNKECIYKEGRIICHAKINDVRLEEDWVEATITVIPTLGFFAPSQAFWTIGSIKECFSFDSEYWSNNSGIYWRVYFNSIVIQKVTDFAKNLLVETDEINRRTALGNYLKTINSKLKRETL